MSKILMLFILIFLGLTTQAQAQLEYYERRSDGNCYLVSEPAANSAFIFEAYDNARGGFAGGNTVLNQTIVTGGRQVGDDLNLVGFQNQTLDSTIFTIANTSTTQALRVVTVSQRWHDEQGRQVGRVETRGAFFPPLPPGQSRIVFDAQDFLDSFNITLRDRVFMSTQFSDPIGPDVSELGQLAGGPINTGSSSRFIRDFTRGVDIDLGSNQINLGYAIRLNAVPSPGVASLGVLGLVAMSNRRRK
ncbi:MAG: hypothetical protein SFZ23_09835 [Planctomycetota bacterium]|nr:hypothetical protein [Planctomycetota bacterium]